MSEAGLMSPRAIHAYGPSLLVSHRPRFRARRPGLRGEIEPRVLRGQGEFAERVLLRQDIAEGDALVVGPQDDVHAPVRRVLLPQRRRRARCIGRGPSAGPRTRSPRSNRSTASPSRRPRSRGRAPGAPSEVEPERRIGQDRRPLVGHAVVEPLAGEVGLGLGLERERDDEAAVGRSDGQRRGALARARVAGHSGGDGQERGEKDERLLYDDMGSLRKAGQR